MTRIMARPRAGIRPQVQFVACLSRLVPLERVGAHAWDLSDIQFVAGIVWAGVGERDKWTVSSVAKAKEDAIQVSGKVLKALANTQFQVELENGHRLIAHVA